MASTPSAFAGSPLLGGHRYVTPHGTRNSFGVAGPHGATNPPLQMPYVHHPPVQSWAPPMLQATTALTPVTTTFLPATAALPAAPALSASTVTSGTSIVPGMATPSAPPVQGSTGAGTKLKGGWDVAAPKPMKPSWLSCGTGPALGAAPLLSAPALGAAPPWGLGATTVLEPRYTRSVSPPLAVVMTAQSPTALSRPLVLPPQTTAVVRMHTAPVASQLSSRPAWAEVAPSQLSPRTSWRAAAPTAAAALLPTGALSPRPSPRPSPAAAMYRTTLPTTSGIATPVAMTPRSMTPRIVRITGPSLTVPLGARGDDTANAIAAATGSGATGSGPSTPTFTFGGSSGAATPAAGGLPMPKFAAHAATEPPPALTTTLTTTTVVAKPAPVSYPAQSTPRTHTPRETHTTPVVPVVVVARGASSSSAPAKDSTAPSSPSSPSTRASPPTPGPEAQALARLAQLAQRGRQQSGDMMFAAPSLSDLGQAFSAQVSTVGGDSPARPQSLRHGSPGKQADDSVAASHGMTMIELCGQAREREREGGGDGGDDQPERVDDDDSSASPVARFRLDSDGQAAAQAEAEAQAEPTETQQEGKQPNQQPGQSRLAALRREREASPSKEAEERWPSTTSSPQRPQTVSPARSGPGPPQVDSPPQRAARTSTTESSSRSRAAAVGSSGPSGASRAQATPPTSPRLQKQDVQEASRLSALEARCRQLERNLASKDTEHSNKVRSLEEKCSRAARELERRERQVDELVTQGQALKQRLKDRENDWKETSEQTAELEREVMSRHRGGVATGRSGSQVGRGRGGSPSQRGDRFEAVAAVAVNQCMSHDDLTTSTASTLIPGSEGVGHAPAPPPKPRAATQPAVSGPQGSVPPPSQLRQPQAAGRAAIRPSPAPQGGPQPAAPWVGTRR